ncbi:uncharacterized protein G2W53_033664 [Senna tora]|uniref:Uncharacterized protein n=1 Tax=Senna tora TaxID=362788 RepID=A0A834W8L7_9FABA|nr:uncharacterized protein G2W53_033664 [Senna tora]
MGGGAWIMSQHIPNEISRSDLRNLHELRGKRLVALVSQTRRFANRRGFDAPIGVVLAWEERGSCLNIFPTTNHGPISKTFTNYEAKDLLRKRLGMGGAWIISQHISDDKSWSDLRNLLELRGKRLVKQVSQTRRFALYSGTGLVLMLQLESSWHGRRSVDHVSTYSGRKIAVGSQKPSRITRQKTCCASESNTSVRELEWFWCSNWSRLGMGGAESNTSVRVEFANRSGFDAPIGVVLAWEEERGSFLNIFRTKNLGRISGTFTNYETKDLLRKSVDHVSTCSGRQITVGSQKPSRITRQKTCCATESKKSVRVVLANRSGFDATIGVVLAWEERGSYFNIFRTTNRGRISETITNYEAKDLLRNRLGMGGAWIMSKRISDDKSQSDLRNLHELRGKRLVAQVSQTSRFALYSRTGVVLMLQLESSWLGTRSVDRVSTYSGRQIAVGSQKPSRITRQKTCCATESNTSVRVVLANRSGFDATIGVVLAWEERGSCLNIFRTTNRGRISETFTNYEAKGPLRNGFDAPIDVVLAWEEHGSCLNTSVRILFANRSGFDAPIGVVLAWEERGSCLNIFRMTNRGRISETFTNYEGKDLLCK